jgi:hypothetical protein
LFIGVCAYSASSVLALFQKPVIPCHGLSLPDIWLRKGTKRVQFHFKIEGWIKAFQRIRKWSAAVWGYNFIIKF